MLYTIHNYRPFRFALLALFAVAALSTACSVQAQARWRGYPAPRKGIVVMDVHFDSGRVTTARLLKGTGDPSLDATALRKFRRARFKPRTVRQVTTPFKFGVTGIDL
jgi:TonB family protein